MARHYVCVMSAAASWVDNSPMSPLAGPSVGTQNPSQIVVVSLHLFIADVILRDIHVLTASVTLETSVSAGSFYVQFEYAFSSHRPNPGGLCTGVEDGL